MYGLSYQRIEFLPEHKQLTHVGFGVKWGKYLLRAPSGHKVPRLRSCHPANGVPEPDSSGGSSVARRLHRRAVSDKGIFTSKPT